MRNSVGILSLLPLLSFLAIFFIEPLYWPNYLTFFDNLRIFIGIVTIVSIAGFSWYSLKAHAVPSQKRQLWVAILFFANIFALPFFWFLLCPQTEYLS